MKWLEIIELQTAHIDQSLFNQLVNYVLQKFKDECLMQVYVNVQVGTEWSIHIQHNSYKIEKNGSELGKQLNAILKEFGLVNHSVWIERK